MLYTPTQAAAITGLPLKAVQKAIDSRTIPAQLRRVGRVRKRYVDNDALICLRLEADGLKQLPAALRNRIYQRIVRRPRLGRLQFSDVLWIDLAAVRKEVATAAKNLRRIEDMIVSDPEIRLAPIYARAHPKRGRPASRPWARYKPIRRVRKRFPLVA